MPSSLYAFASWALWFCAWETEPVGLCPLVPAAITTCTEKETSDRSGQTTKIVYSVVEAAGDESGQDVKR